MKATRNTMDAPGKMALIIPGIMIAVSTWKTVNILMLEESEKIFTGTVTSGYTTMQNREEDSQDISFEN